MSQGEPETLIHDRRNRPTEPTGRWRTVSYQLAQHRLIHFTRALHPAVVPPRRMLGAHLTAELSAHRVA